LNVFAEIFKICHIGSQNFDTFLQFSNIKQRQIVKIKSFCLWKIFKILEYKLWETVLKNITQHTISYPPPLIKSCASALFCLRKIIFQFYSFEKSTRKTEKLKNVLTIKNLNSSDLVLICLFFYLRRFPGLHTCLLNHNN